MSDSFIIPCLILRSSIFSSSSLCEYSSLSISSSFSRRRRSSSFFFFSFSLTRNLQTPRISRKNTYRDRKYIRDLLLPAYFLLKNVQGYTLFKMYPYLCYFSASFFRYRTHVGTKSVILI